MSTENQYFFGRMEKQLDQIGDKIDKHGETLAQHAVRLDRVEKDVEGLQTTQQADQSAEIKETVSRRGALWVGVALAIVAAVATKLIDVLIQTGH